MAEKASDKTDEYEEYDMEPEKYVHSGHSGKGRTKKEASQHTNHPDPCGHVRKTTQKLINNSHNQRKVPDSK